MADTNNVLWCQEGKEVTVVMLTEKKILPGLGLYVSRQRWLAAALLWAICYLIKPSARSASCTAGRAATRAMKALRLAMPERFTPTCLPQPDTTNR